MLQGHLKMVEGHIALGLQSIGRQRAVIERLDAKGLDLVRANAVLLVLLDAQKQHEQHRDRLKLALGQ